MTRELQECLHFMAQQAIFFFTLAQLLIFVAMGSLFRAKRDYLPRYIAGVLQLFVINGIAWLSGLYGFIAFLATYTLSFVWQYRFRDRILTGTKSEDIDPVTEAGDETGVEEVENIDDFDRYENIDDTESGAP